MSLVRLAARAAVAACGLALTMSDTSKTALKALVHHRKEILAKAAQFLREWPTKAVQYMRTARSVRTGSDMAHATIAQLSNGIPNPAELHFSRPSFTLHTRLGYTPEHGVIMAAELAVLGDDPAIATPMVKLVRLLLSWAMRDLQELPAT